jgi:hypothetical protein
VEISRAQRSAQGIKEESEKKGKYIIVSIFYLIWVFQLEDLLNLDPKIELNSHEMRLANQIGKYRLLICFFISLLTTTVLPNEGVEIEEVGGCYELLRQLENNIIAPLLIRSSNIHIPSAYYSPPKGLFIRYSM